jgi:hypothetical protein
MYATLAFDIAAISAAGPNPTVRCTGPSAAAQTHNESNSKTAGDMSALTMMAAIKDK